MRLPAHVGHAPQELLGSAGGMLQVLQGARLVWPGALHQHATGVIIAHLHSCQEIAPMHVRPASLLVPEKARHPI